MSLIHFAFRAALHFFLLSWATLASALPRIEVNFSPMANFTYQLDCISKVVRSCSFKNYEKLWAEKFILNEKDEQFVKSWSELRNRYLISVDLEKQDWSAWYQPRVDIWTKFRIAGFQAQNKKDYLERLDLVINFADQKKVIEIFDAFYPRFEVWFNETALAQGKDFKKQMKDLLSDHVVNEVLSKAFNFYKSEMTPESTLNFSLIYRPVLVDESKRYS